MNLQNAKIYHDGSHFIAIPQGAYPSGKGCKRRKVKPMQQLLPTSESPPETPKERFEKAYKKSQSLPKRERKTHIKESLAADFPDKTSLKRLPKEAYSTEVRNLPETPYTIFLKTKSIRAYTGITAKFLQICIRR